MKAALSRESYGVIGEGEFTAEQQARIQAHIRARGMTFEVFLPESLTNWLHTKLAEGAFSDAKEAAFIAFQNLQKLDRHPEPERAHYGDSPCRVRQVTLPRRSSFARIESVVAVEVTVWVARRHHCARNAPI
jgi:hypothetical protein